MYILASQLLQLDISPDDKDGVLTFREMHIPLWMINRFLVQENFQVGDISLTCIPRHGIKVPTPMNDTISYTEGGGLIDSVGVYVGKRKNMGVYIRLDLRLFTKWLTQCTRMTTS
jgi:hypothetical protein